VFAISYDRTADLGAFAAPHGITYPLLGDEGSVAIRALGVLDLDLEAHQAVFGVAVRPEQQGVAFPMTFVLDERGVVIRKIVEENYRIRYGGRSLVAELTGAPVAGSGQGLEARANEAVVSARATLDALAYFPFQRLRLDVRLDVARGWHVYGRSVPPGYTGLAIDVTSEPDGVRLGPIAWPATTPFRVAGLAEEFAVSEGALTIGVPLEFRVPRNSGTVKLDVAVRFQACSATGCLPPSSIGLTLAVPEAPAL